VINLDREVLGGWCGPGRVAACWRDRGVAAEFADADGVVRREPLGLLELSV
jgi:hypothetical protein